MYPIYFDAVLKSEGGKITEYGEACISHKENKINFKSDFVPLFKLGEKVEIIRTLGEKEFEVFSGEVYLSSRNLLQITSVDEQLISQARQLFAVNANIPATFVVSPGKSSMFNTKKAELVTGTIRYVSQDVFKISAMQYIGEGHYLYLDVEQPVVLRKTLLFVEQRHLFTRQASICICRLISQPLNERKELAEYLEKLSELSEESE